MHTMSTRFGTKPTGWATSWLVALVIMLVTIAIITSPLATPASPGLSNGQRQVLARTEATHLLLLATLPVGSKKLSPSIAADQKALATPADAPHAPAQVDLAYYYLAPGGRSAFAWLQRQVPKGGRLFAIGSLSRQGNVDVSFLSFSFRGTSVLHNPELQYSTLITRQGQLALHVDAFVSWTP